MLVADVMTRRPVTVSPRATVAAAVSAMRRGRFRHLPVVAGPELVGVVSDRDLEVSPGAPVEVAEALGDRPVAEVMTSQPITVWPDEPVEVAARLLVDHAIGCLPVVAGEELVGILTESDMFAVLLRLLGGGEPSSRITLVLPDVPGALGRAMTVVGELGVNLLTVVTEPGPEPGTRGVVLRAGTINAAPLVAALLAAGLSLLRAAKVLHTGDLLAFGPAGDADLELIHDRDYLEAVARFSADPAPADPVEATRFGLVGDNRPFPGLDEAARLVAGATMAALDAVADGRLTHVFAPVAGLHHAQRRRA